MDAKKWLIHLTKMKRSGKISNIKTLDRTRQMKPNDISRRDDGQDHLRWLDPSWSAEPKEERGAKVGARSRDGSDKIGVGEHENY
jgi:hypothetical protein